MDEQECWTVAGVADFGAQGGDPARAVGIDLGTGVNRDGPAPAARGCDSAGPPVSAVCAPPLIAQPQKIAVSLPGS